MLEGLLGLESEKKSIFCAKATDNDFFLTVSVNDDRLLDGLLVDQSVLEVVCNALFNTAAYSYDTRMLQFCVEVQREVLSKNCEVIFHDGSVGSSNSNSSNRSNSNAGNSSRSQAAISCACDRLEDALSQGMKHGFGNGILPLLLPPVYESTLGQSHRLGNGILPLLLDPSPSTSPSNTGNNSGLTQY